MAPGRQGTRFAPGDLARRLIPDRGFGWITGMVSWALFLVMTVPDGLDYAALNGHAPDAPNGSVLTKVLWLSMLGLSAAVVMMRLSVARRVLKHTNPFLLFFAALSLASIVWSINSGQTALRDMRFVVVMLVSLAFASTDWSPNRFAKEFRGIFFAFLGGSIIFGIVRPDLAIHQELSYELVGAWRGLTTHKNGLGNLGTLGLVFWMHGLVTRRVPTFGALIGVATCFACVLLSRSSTSLAMALEAVLVSMVFMKLPPRMARHIPTFVWTLTALCLIYGMAMLKIIPGSGILFAPITMITGKNLTFTGRADIWEVILDHVRLRPLLGSGYGAYWDIAPTPGNESYAMYVRLHSFYPTQAHNGYLDVLNDLGYVGLLALMGMLVFYVRQALRLYTQLRRPAQGSLYLLLFLQQAMANFTEAHWLSVRSVNFIIMTFATFALARDTLDATVEHRHETDAEAARRIAQARRPLPPEAPS
jgi:O-antigen ligase